MTACGTNGPLRHGTKQLPAVVHDGVVLVVRSAQRLIFVCCRRTSPSRTVARRQIEMCVRTATETVRKHPHLRMASSTRQSDMLRSDTPPLLPVGRTVPVNRLAARPPVRPLVQHCVGNVQRNTPRRSRHTCTSRPDRTLTCQHTRHRPHRTTQNM
jgi:hypothetical protein